MAIDYLVGWTKPQLEIELRRCQEELVRGKTLVGSGAADVNFTHRIEQEIINRIELILKKLSRLDPVAYPPASNTAIDRYQIVMPDSTTLY